MPLLLALLAQAAASTLAAPSLSAAAPDRTVRFTLEPEQQESSIRVNFRREGERNFSSWSTSYPIGELAGLDLARLHAAESGPVHFAIVREAGRIDCAGSGSRSLAIGTCGATADPAFLRLLASERIEAPTENEAFALVAANVRRELVEALVKAGYPTPRINHLVALQSVGVDARYIAELASAGYRPEEFGELLSLRALRLTPDYVGSFVRAGYVRLSARQLMQFKALRVTPEFIAGFRELGYGNLAVGELVRLKALGISPDFVRSVQRDNKDLPSVDELVRYRTARHLPWGWR